MEKEVASKQSEVPNDQSASRYADLYHDCFYGVVDNLPSDGSGTVCD